MSDNTCHCSDTCDEHHCNPPDEFPTELSERWTCPTCGNRWRAYDVHAETPPRQQASLKRVPVGTIGWTTRESCWQPCDPDCENGPTHCINLHLPKHKWVAHTPPCNEAGTPELRALLHRAATSPTIKRNRQKR